MLNSSIRLLPPVAAALVCSVVAPLAHAQPPTRISAFGRYDGWTEARYTTWIRTSEYVTVRDGTRLAVDVIRPAVNGRPAEGRFPVVWSHTRYRLAG